MPVRCALGCERSGTHRFPSKCPEQFEAWVHVMGGKLEKTEDYAQYCNKRICPIHFLPTDYNCNNRLNRLAVPTLHLPAWCSTPKPVIDTSDIDTTQEWHPYIKPFDNSTTTTRITNDTNQGNQSHTSKTTTETYAIDIKTEQGNLPLSETAISTAPCTEIVVKTEACSGARVDSEHNYTSKSKAAKKNHHSSASLLQVQKIKNLTQQICNLRREICRLRKRSLTYKAKLAEARKMTDEMALKRVTKNMSEAAKLFTYMNYRESSKKPKGHRFTLNEKILALSIFKASPECYKLLAKHFALPTKKCLKASFSMTVSNPGENTMENTEPTQEYIVEAQASSPLSRELIEEMQFFQNS